MDIDDGVELLDYHQTFIVKGTLGENVSPWRPKVTSRFWNNQISCMILDY